MLNGQGFVDATLSAGLATPHDGDPPTEAIFSIGSGAAWIDFDNDDDLDLYVTFRNTKNKLYRNNGDETFSDVATALGISDIDGDGGGVSVVDYNNDGWKDIFLANNDGCRLYKNNGGTSFTNVTVQAGLQTMGTSRGMSATWGDYDKDGYLDLYLVHHMPINLSLPSFTTQDYLFHNNGGATFTNVSALLDIDKLMGSGFIAGWTDYDRDNDLDIILINDCPVGIFPKETTVFRNDGGEDGLNWNFSEQTIAAGLEDCRNGMGIAIGDYNRDGWMDIAYSNIGDCVLFKNNSGVFEDVSAIAAINTQDENHFSWASNFFDYDLDGWVDLFFCLGSLSNTSEADPHPNDLFKNTGEGTFIDVSNSQNMGDMARSRNAAIGDYDNDGDEDVFIVNYDEMPILKRNDNSGNSFLKVELEGVSSNRDGIGAKLKLTLSDGSIQYDEAHNSTGYGSSNAPFIHFGLGTVESITELEVIWPSGIIDTWTNLSVNSTFDAVEGSSALPVELLSFEVEQVVGNRVLIHWESAQEYNNELFIIERSSNSYDFSEIARVEGAGNSFYLISYSILDEEPLIGRSYYRLKMQELGGTHQYSRIRTILFEPQEDWVTIHPNPVTTDQILSISFSESLKTNLTIQLLNVQGQVLFEEQFFNDTGEWTIDLQAIPELESGIHYLNVVEENTDRRFIEKVVILN